MSSSGSSWGSQSTDDATYSGVVLATARQGGGGTTYSVFADFAPGAGFGPGQCEADGGACSCSYGIADPDVFDTPGAGEVIVADDAGLIAALSPASVVTYGETVTTSYQGIWDLGQPWSDYAGVYPLADAGAWRPGDALQVSATGGPVSASC